MRPLLKFFRVRRRDALALVLLWIYSVLSLVSCLITSYLVFVHIPRIRAKCDAAITVSTNYLDKCYQSVSVYNDSLDSIRRDIVSGMQLSAPVATNDVVLGSGCVRLSTGRLLRYTDVRKSDGQTERRYGQ